MRAQRAQHLLRPTLQLPTAERSWHQTVSSHTRAFEVLERRHCWLIFQSMALLDLPRSKHQCIPSPLTSAAVIWERSLVRRQDQPNSQGSREAKTEIGAHLFSAAGQLLIDVALRTPEG